VLTTINAVMTIIVTDRISDGLASYSLRSLIREAEDDITQSKIRTDQILCNHPAVGDCDEDLPPHSPSS